MTTVTTVTAAITATIGEWLARAYAFAAQHALALAFFGAMAENTILLGLLTPGGPVVALAAAGARQAGQPLPLVIALAAAGMTAGAAFDYLVGRAGGQGLLRHPRAGRIGERLSAQLDAAQFLLYRHGWWVVLIAHAWSYARTGVALAAGASRLPPWRFLRFEVPAALVWSTVWCTAGYAVAGHAARLEPYLHYAGIAAVAGAAVLLLGRRYLAPMRRRPRDPGRQGGLA